MRSTDLRRRPSPPTWPVGIILGLFGLAGFVYQIHVISSSARSILPLLIGSLIGSTGLCFSVVPMFGDASLIAGAPGLIAEKPFAPNAIAGAITLLLLAGIYGAWSVTLWIARNRDKT